jgi:hypothetical protein
LKPKQQAIAFYSIECYGVGMARNDLRALRNLIFDAHRILATARLPEGRSERAYELLSAALHLADHLLTESPAAALGKKGGKETAKRGPEYFRQIASMRKEHKGGRPRKDSKPN